MYSQYTLNIAFYLQKNARSRYDALRECFALWTVLHLLHIRLKIKNIMDILSNFSHQLIKITKKKFLLPQISVK